MLLRTLRLLRDSLLTLLLFVLVQERQWLRLRLVRPQPPLPLLSASRAFHTEALLCL